MICEQIRFVTPLDKNGNTFQLKVDVANRKYAYGYCLFIADKDDIHLSKKELQKLIDGFKWFGWTEIENF